MSEKKVTQDKNTAADINIDAGEVTLPFAHPRTKLLAEYVANAVPRSGSYQQWLTEHYDMAYSLGLEKGDGDEASQGEGLTLNPTTKKLAVKVNSTAATAEAGAIRTGTDGLSINVGKDATRKGLKGVTSGTAGIVLGIDHDDSLKIVDSSGKLGVNFGNVIPRGLIVMFSGSKAPTNWAFCDGTNNTPDLRGKFIKCSATVSESTDGISGGSATVAYRPEGEVNVASHALTIDEIPEHSHSYIRPRGLGGNNDVARGSDFADTEQSTTKAGGGKGHTHEATFTGTPKNIDTEPPYYVLAYIMKL